MESAIMKTVVKTTIRAYIIDQYMRGVFVNSVFGETEEMDNVILEYLAQELKSGLYLYDDAPAPFPKGAYREKFLDEVTQLYEAELEENDELAEAVGDDYEVTDEDGATETDAGEFVADEALKYFIKQEYPDVASKLKQIFNVTKPDSEKSIDDVFIEEYLPHFPIATTATEARFVNSAPSIQPGDTGVIVESPDDPGTRIFAQTSYVDEDDVEHLLTTATAYDSDKSGFLEPDELIAASAYETANYDFSLHGVDGSLQNFLDFNRITDSASQAGVSQSFFSKALANPFDSTNGTFYTE